jgi:hypothetical protein
VTHEINTGRGLYRIVLAAPPAVTAEGVTLTLSFERADGLERVGFLCAIAHGIPEAAAELDTNATLLRLAPWFERDFEQTREAALKSLRSERKPLVVRFDREHPGPFGSGQKNDPPHDR